MADRIRQTERNQMVEHKATILLEGKVITKDLSVWIETIVTPGGLKDWHGAFALPTGSLFCKPEDTSKVHHIVLEDGREGDILIAEQQFGSHELTRVRFQGTGPLAVRDTAER